jgi:hypothetical membrane protein
MRTVNILGIVGATIGYPLIAITILLSSWFNFYDNALSDLGNLEINMPVAELFNISLIMTGVLISIFGGTILFQHHSWKYIIWTIPLTIAGIELSLIGGFPENVGNLHYIFSVAFFATTVITLLVYSYSSWPLGTPKIGALALLFGITSAFIWFVEWPWKGVAIQETISAIFASIWLILVSIRNI